PFLQSLLPFLKGFTVFFWVTGSWWIPMLLILGFWRHVVKKFPLKYDVLYWGAIFPLGMYAVSTHQMIKAMNLWFLSEIPRYFIYVGLLAWLVAFSGLVHGLVRSLWSSMKRRT
ncbi:MAG: C4-dicarboxylate ABC transporter, partial [Spirochaetales bacterium]|nr:C4-dicarboxylate ABC transporter [Spirochaetales bacterium]